MTYPNPSDSAQRPDGAQGPGQPTFPRPGPTPGPAADFSPAGAGAGSPAGHPPDPSAAPGAHQLPEDDGASGAPEEAKRFASDTAGRAQDVAGTAKQEVSALTDAARSAGDDVVTSAKEEAGHLVDEAKQHSRELVDAGMGELKQQARVGQEFAAELVRSFSGELETMTSNADQSGPVVDLAVRAKDIGTDVADWLERHEPEDVLESVRRYAARKPWTFLAISAAVGFVGARLVRGLQAADDSPAVGGTAPVRRVGSGSISSTSTNRLSAPSYSDDAQRLGGGARAYADDLRVDEARRDAATRLEEEAQAPGLTPYLGGEPR